MGSGMDSAQTILLVEGNPGHVALASCFAQFWLELNQICH
jgi:hypothetical protein